MPQPRPDIVLDLIEAFRRSKTMFVAVALGIFDALESPATANDLAERLGAQFEPLERLLDGCVGLGLLRKSGEVYVNEPVASTYLRRESEDALTGYILYSDQVLFRLWEHLEEAVREGGNRWRQVLGEEGGIFDHFFRTEEATRTFLRGMHGFGRLSAPGAVAAFDLSRFRRLVDLGGGAGNLAIAARERYPGIRAAVFELPRVVACAPKDDRIEWVSGDFFQDELPKADLFALGQIIHDWTDETLRPLLRKVFERLPAGGGLLVVERMLADDKTGPVPALMQSLNMLLCTEGRERTFGEFRALLEEAGFSSVEARSTGTAFHAVLAIK